MEGRVLIHPAFFVAGIWQGLSSCGFIGGLWMKTWGFPTCPGKPVTRWREGTSSTKKRLICLSGQSHQGEYVCGYLQKKA